MSYNPRLAARPLGSVKDDGSDTKKGSVREARERLQAAQVQSSTGDRPRIVGLPQRPNQLVSQFSHQNRQQESQEQNLTPPDSREQERETSQSPQWPLPREEEDVVDDVSGPYQRAPGRGPPPQRPPRPISDQLSISADEYRDSYQSDEIMSPASATPSSRPLTTSSLVSETSSLGSIPDFPVPLPPMPVVQPLPRRQPSLGPPPSARRGPSSYYTQMSYVSPIAEESETRSDIIRSQHGSFASSNVFPLNDDDYYLQDEERRSDDDETVTSDYGRDSRGSDLEDRNDPVQPALLRQASLGRRTRPSLMTIKSVDSFGEKKSSSMKRKPIAEGAASMGAAAAIGGAVLAARDGIAGRRVPGKPPASLATGTALLDRSSSEEEPLPKSIKPTVPVEDLEKEDYTTSDSENDDYLDKDLEKGGFVSSVYPVQQSATQTTLANRMGKRRPPRIDVDAVREAEARGSLTSLPELIRRATRLAANLDRGRTASRLGLDLWESGAPEKNGQNGRRSGSLSDMLAAFPPPGEATSTGDRTPNPKADSKWPSSRRAGTGGTGSGPSESDTKRRRRCCGMPMWTFITLFIVLIFLIAAAVVIPIVLIVIPKMNDGQTNTPQNTGGSGGGNNISPLPPPIEPASGDQKNQCTDIISCRNGGVAIFNADRSCNCVCINGFTGKVCEVEGDAACTTTNMSSTADNATVGTSIPRLLESAQNNFSIPLDASSLLALFSDLSLSCTTENALVTFNGLAVRSVLDLVDLSLEPSKSLPLLESPHRDEDVQEVRKFEKRQQIGPDGEPSQRPSPTATSSPQASAIASPALPISRNTTALDFARIGVLLLLQETRVFDDAAKAQVAIQGFLSDDGNDDSNGNTIDLGLFEMDLVQLSMQFQNGTILQARRADPSPAA